MTPTLVASSYPAQTVAGGASRDDPASTKAMAWNDHATSQYLGDFYSKGEMLAIFSIISIIVWLMAYLLVLRPTKHARNFSNNHTCCFCLKIEITRGWRMGQNTAWDIGPFRLVIHLSWLILPVKMVIKHQLTLATNLYHGKKHRFGSIGLERLVISNDSCWLYTSKKCFLTPGGRCNHLPWFNQL